MINATTDSDNTVTQKMTAGFIFLKKIVRGSDEKKPFVVLFTIGRDSFELSVNASELQAFTRFQKAALERASIMIRITGGVGWRTDRRRWAADVDRAIQEGANGADENV